MNNSQDNQIKNVPTPPPAPAPRNNRRWIIVAVIAFIICLFFVIFFIRKHNESKKRLELEQLVDSIRSEDQYDIMTSEQLWKREDSRTADSLEAVRESLRVESEARMAEEVGVYERKFSRSRLETMVKELTREGYFADVWEVDNGTSDHVVIYEKGGKTYIRKINPETDKFGPPTRLRKYEEGVYHVYGDKTRWYKRGSGENRYDLIYEVKGVEKARYYGMTSIELDTPIPVPDGYDDWGDYYEDNEEE